MKNLENMLDKTWFLDIDDTLIDTAKASPIASEGVEEVFSSEVRAEFDRLFNLMLQGHQASKGTTEFTNKEAYEELLKQIEILQSPIKEKFGVIKKFSRETFLKIALDNTNIKYEIDQLIQAVDNYWSKISEVSEVFPGVTNFLEAIENTGGTRVFVTSSDARLTYDGKVFDYDPEHSEAKKKIRIDSLAKLGIKYDYLSIGDPEDKPDPAFFRKAIDLVEKSRGEKLDLSNCVIAGDSFSSDIKTPIEEMGFGLGVVFKKGQLKVIWENNKIVSTGNLMDLFDPIQQRHIPSEDLE